MAIKRYLPKYQYDFDAQGEVTIRLPDEDLAGFNTSLLNIGRLNAPSVGTVVLAVMLDLEGFTKFVNPRDPQNRLALFICDFYEWLFERIRESLVGPIDLCAELPFFSKFLGDGVLLLWNADGTRLASGAKDSQVSGEENAQTMVCNVIACMLSILEDYEDFRQALSHKTGASVPERLRCGVAKGMVFSIGGGNDYVGPCINISARLEKFRTLPFACAADGINLKYFHPEYQSKLVRKKVDIRGINDAELIYLRQSDFDQMSPAERKEYRDPV